MTTSAIVTRDPIHTVHADLATEFLTRLFAIGVNNEPREVLAYSASKSTASWESSRESLKIKVGRVTYEISATEPGTQ